METTGEPIMERIARKELEALQARVVPEVVSHLLESAILMDPLAQVIREEVQVELAKQATTFSRHPNAGPSVWQPTGHTTTVTDPIRQYGEGVVPTEAVQAQVTSGQAASVQRETPLVATRAGGDGSAERPKGSRHSRKDSRKGKTNKHKTMKRRENLSGSESESN